MLGGVVFKQKDFKYLKSKIACSTVESIVYIMLLFFLRSRLMALKRMGIVKDYEVGFCLR